MTKMSKSVYSCVSEPDEDLKKQYFQLRKREYLTKLKYPIPISDALDRKSYIFVIIENGTKVVAGSRLTVARSNRFLPMEEGGFLLNKFIDIGDHKYAEYSRLVIDPDHSGNGLEMLLNYTVDKFCRMHSIRYVFSLVPLKHARLYNRGFRAYRNEGGNSKYSILDDIVLPESVIKKHGGVPERLTVVEIGLANIRKDNVG